MDEGFQFIIESPHLNTSHKKRPRLVTSCDNCRLKKIKCLQPSPESKCEACKTAKIACKFRDRERYFAERSRAIAGPALGTAYGEESGQPALDAFSVASHSSNSSNVSDSRSTSRSPQASGVVVADGDHHTRYQQYAPDGRRSFDSHRHATSPAPNYPSSRDPSAYNYLPHNGSMLPHSRPQSTRPPLQLFEPDHPQYPHSSFMPHLIQVFFEQLGKEFTFITFDDISTQYWERSLPPLLANVIASMGSRFSSHPELVVRGLALVSETYLDMAKSILGATQTPSLDTLHAVMLFAWSEYKSGRSGTFRSYVDMAMRMAPTLGLSEHTLHMAANERERTKRQASWAGILQLSITAQSLRQ